MSINIPNPGHLLKTKREALQLTPEKIAAQLHFPVRIIYSLEENNYPKNISLVFIKGYLRTYARFLKISETTLMEHYELFISKKESSLHPDETHALTKELNIKPEKTYFNPTSNLGHLRKLKVKHYLLLILVITITIFICKDLFQPKVDPINTEANEHLQEMPIANSLTTVESHNG
jgi:cytoskeletal protein RodZ